MARLFRKCDGCDHIVYEDPDYGGPSPPWDNAVHPQGPWTKTWNNQGYLFCHLACKRRTEAQETINCSSCERTVPSALSRKFSLSGSVFNGWLCAECSDQVEGTLGNQRKGGGKKGDGKGAGKEKGDGKGAGKEKGDGKDAGKGEKRGMPY